MAEKGRIQQSSLNLPSSMCPAVITGLRSRLSESIRLKGIFM